MFEWTEDRVEVLTQLWDQGLSASEIAARLPGTTRNSVIGKVHRVGLPRRADSPGHATAHSTMSRRGCAKQRKSREAITMARTRRGNPISDALKKIATDKAHERSHLPLANAPLVAFVDLEDGHCRFPHETGEGRKFCGCSQVPGLPYCESHLAVAYRPLLPITNETEHFKLYRRPNEVFA